MGRFLPKTRMGVFTFVLVAFWIARMFLSAPLGHVSSGLALLLNLTTLLLVIPAIYYSLKLTKGIRDRLPVENPAASDFGQYFHWRHSCIFCNFHFLVFCPPVLLSAEPLSYF